MPKDSLCKRGAFEHKGVHDLGRDDWVDLKYFWEKQVWSTCSLAKLPYYIFNFG